MAGSAMSVQVLGRAAAPAAELRSVSRSTHLGASSSSFAAHVAIGGGPAPSPRHAATRQGRSPRAQELPPSARHVSSRASSREDRLRKLVARAEGQRTDAKAAVESTSEASSSSSPADPAAQASSEADAAESLSTSAAESSADRPPAQAQAQAQAQGQAQGSQKLSLEDVNPVGLGRRSRQFLDDVWRRLLDLGQLARPLPADEDEEEALIQGPNCEFAIPAAQFTKVLVVGPTGRVGRVLVRKLLLRGYSVRALVRKADFQTMEQLPGAAEVLEADFEGELTSAALMQAVQGCQKVIYCATARTPTADKLAAVDTAGVVKLSKALLDYNHHLAQRRAGRSSKSKAVVVKFKKERYQQGWKLREGRVAGFGAPGAAQGAGQGLADEGLDDEMAELGADAEFEITDKGHGLFQGFVVERGAFVEVKRVLEMPDGLSLGRFEGLVIRLVGDGRPYSLVLETDTPHYRPAPAQPAADVSATLAPVPEEAELELEAAEKGGEGTWSVDDWMMSDDDEGLDGAAVGNNKQRAHTAAAVAQKPRPVAAAAPAAAAANGAANGALLASNGAVRGIAEPCQYVARFNTRKGPATVRVPFSAFRPTEVGMPPLDPSNVSSLALRFEQRRPKSKGAPMKEGAADPYSFRLEVDFIKAFPGGDETDFILVSCTGAAVPEDARPAVIKAKLAAETQLRNSGLGYTIVRPGPLFEEPGGRKALVFDQGNRISQGISCADVADVCVKALHDPLARNKSFDICYEYGDGSGLYELVAHLPDKANNYLTPALALLEKNT